MTASHVHLPTGTPLVPHVGTCHVTGKLMIPRRRDARRVIRTMHAKGMREYRCAFCGYFHTGHLPLVVLRGALVASEVYG